MHKNLFTIIVPSKHMYAFILLYTKMSMGNRVIYKIIYTWENGDIRGRLRSTYPSIKHTSTQGKMGWLNHNQSNNGTLFSIICLKQFPNPIIIFFLSYFFIFCCNMFFLSCNLVIFLVKPYSYSVSTLFLFPLYFEDNESVALIQTMKILYFDYKECNLESEMLTNAFTEYHCCNF